MKMRTNTRTVFDRARSSKTLDMLGAYPDKYTMAHLYPDAGFGEGVVMYHGTRAFDGITLIAATVAYPHTDVPLHAKSKQVWTCVVPLQSAHSFGNIDTPTQRNGCHDMPR